MPLRGGWRPLCGLPCSRGAPGLADLQTDGSRSLWRPRCRQGGKRRPCAGPRLAAPRPRPACLQESGPGPGLRAHGCVRVAVPPPPMRKCTAISASGTAARTRVAAYRALACQGSAKTPGDRCALCRSREPLRERATTCDLMLAARSESLFFKPGRRHGHPRRRKRMQPRLPPKCGGGGGGGGGLCSDGGTFPALGRQGGHPSPARERATAVLLPQLPPPRPLPYLFSRWSPRRADVAPPAQSPPCCGPQGARRPAAVCSATMAAVLCRASPARALGAATGSVAPAP